MTSRTASTHCQRCLMDFKLRWASMGAGWVRLPSYVPSYVRAITITIRTRQFRTGARTHACSVRL